MIDRLAPVLVACLLATPASATFYCEVVEGDANLHAEADSDADVLHIVPAGAYISLFDEEADKSGDWVRVAYDKEQAGPWGTGISGWVLEARLDLCG